MSAGRKGKFILIHVDPPLFKERPVYLSGYGRVHRSVQRRPDGLKQVAELPHRRAPPGESALMASVDLKRKPALLAWIMPRSLKLSPAAMVS